MFGLCSVAAVCLASQTAAFKIERDSYGVPMIHAETAEAAYEGMGAAVAEDRLWQMEMTRLIATGRYASYAGKAGLESDKQTIRTGYTRSELTEMLAALAPQARTAFAAYARGVNQTIEARKASKTLPQGYADWGRDPDPWAPEDSAAIAVMLARRFGTGGAGELRNLALTKYLATQPCKDKWPDVFDDFLWQNDQSAVPTVAEADDPLKDTHPGFPAPTREQTLTQLSATPSVGLLELLPAIRAASTDEQALVAEHVAAPFKTGSYCIVVSPERSATSRPMLLSAPQMGHSDPSIIHETALDAPGLQVAGIDVPGIPGIVIGKTPQLAWGLTTGVADTADIVWAKADATTYSLDGKERPFERGTVNVEVKGEDPVAVTFERTQDGPVILRSSGAGAVFSQRMSYWKRELESWGAVLDVYSAKNAAEIDKAMERVSVNFNLFFAFTGGQTGWRYTGALPIRQTGFDPRLPVPAEASWTGFLQPNQKPHVDACTSGLIVNWNNKPVAWWPNGDTPVWGSVFRNSVLLGAIPNRKLTVSDLELAAWTIARKDTTSNSVFAEAMRKVCDSDAPADREIQGHNDWALNGSTSAQLYRESVRELRRLLFRQHVGNFTSEQFFETAVQPSVMVKALAGRTKFDYLAGRSAQDLLRQAVRGAYSTLASRFGAVASAWPGSLSEIRVPGEPSVPYIDRGTYIQINDLGATVTSRSVASPGVAETGPHSRDQVPLARAWGYKPMWTWPRH